MTQIVLPTPGLSRRAFAWYPEMAWPYESAWSLLHKYCRWNATLQWEIWRQFADRSALGSFITERVNNLVLLTPGWLDVERFHDALREDVPFDEHGSAFASHFINRVAGRSMVAVCSSVLRFCPVCLRAGYHSTLFQIRHVESCPVHAIKLRVGCPACAVLVPYRLPRGRHPAYGCGCGYEFSVLQTPPVLSSERVGRAMRELTLNLAASRLVTLRLAGHSGLVGG